MHTPARWVKIIFFILVSKDDFSASTLWLVSVYMVFLYFNDLTSSLIFLLIYSINPLQDSSILDIAGVRYILLIPLKYNHSSFTATKLLPFQGRVLTAVISWLGVSEQYFVNRQSLEYFTAATVVCRNHCRGRLGPIVQMKGVNEGPTRTIRHSIIATNFHFRFLDITHIFKQIPFSL